jgi:hypothetical protein
MVLMKLWDAIHTHISSHAALDANMVEAVCSQSKYDL